MYRTVFICIIAALVYFTYVSPMVESLQSFTRDDVLHAHMEEFAAISHMDPRSHSKATHHLKSFMLNYSNTFQDTHSSVRKMKAHKYKAIGYLQRIIHRIPNDAALEYRLEVARDAIDAILENYVSEASDRLNVYHFPSHI